MTDKITWHVEKRKIEDFITVTPESLIKTYKLNTPIFAQMCSDGLFEPTIFNNKP